MSKQILQMGKYLFYILYSNTLYGIILYIVFTWLSGFSLLYAYFGNLALIILALVLDEYTHRMLQSEKLVVELKEVRSKGGKSHRLVQWMTDSFVSFKTALYLFYALILVFSQLIDFYPTLFGENLSNFILTNNYSILLLITFDMLIRQFSKDRKRMDKIATDLKKSLDENHDF